MHDAAYKLLFSDRRVVADLLRGFVPSAVADALDLSTLERHSAEYVGEDLRRGTGDMLWQVRSREPAGRGGASSSLLVLLEFQSSVDPAMATRMLDYTRLVHRRRLGDRAPRKGRGVHPPVLPVVFYNGERRWTAAVEVRETVAPVGEALAPYQPSQRYVLVDAGAFGVEDLPAGNRVSALVELENSTTAAALVEKLRAVFGRFGDSEDRGFREALYEWARHMPLMREGGELPGWEELEGGDMATLLEARARQWEGSGCRKASRRASSAVGPKNGRCCAVWRRGSSAPARASGSPGCWTDSRTRSGWPRWASGSSSARRRRSCSTA